MPWNWNFNTEISIDVDEIIFAARNLSSNKIGALIIISRNTDLKSFSNSGIQISALIKRELLISIFQKESPLHDGAVILSSHLIVAASCILPVSQNPNLPRQYGLRHRSAIGLTEQTDALAVVVSEENGGISLAKEGKIYSALTPEDLKDLLEKEINASRNGKS